MPEKWGEYMARTDEQLKFEELYINKMTAFKEAYKVRTDFASQFKLKPEKTKGYMAIGDPAATKTEGGPAGASPTGAGVAIGGLLTIDSYNGPDNSATPKRGGGGSYRRGLKGNLAGTDKWNTKIVEWAGKYNINPWFIKITMALESGGNEKLTESGHNTKYEPGRGLFQITIGAVDIQVDRGRLFDPDYNMECFAQVVEGKIKDAERKGSPLTVFEISWRYNGKIDNNPYPKVVEEIMAGYGQSSSQNIRPSAGGNSNASSGSTENLGGGPPKKSSLSIQSMFSIKRELGKSEVPEKPIQVPAASRMNIPKITRQGQRIVPPDLKRDGYFYSCRLDAASRGWKGWSKLDDSFIHVKGPQSNWYPLESQIAFTLLKDRLGKDKLIVIHGFEPNAEAIPNSAHVAGMAMDIHVDNIYEAIYLADTAWHCGFRAIAIGGEDLTETTPGFVHVDIGPKGFWSYGHHDVYKGPGTFEIIGR